MCEEYGNKNRKVNNFIEFSDLPKKMGDWLIVYD